MAPLRGLWSFSDHSNTISNEGDESPCFIEYVPKGNHRIRPKGNVVNGDVALYNQWQK